MQRKKLLKIRDQLQCQQVLDSSHLPTQPAGKLSEGNQVVAVLVQQGEGAAGQRVGVLVQAAGPRHQQPEQALKLGPV